MRDRIGRFRVPDALIEGCPEALLRFFGQVVVVACEHDWSTSTFVYTALSWRFHPLPTVHPIPVYVPLFRREDDGTVRFLGFEGEALNNVETPS